MTKPTMLLIPKATVPLGSANDYACGSYEGNTNFSCSPYGNKGNIDVNSSSGSGAWGPSIIGAIVNGIISVVISA